MSNPPPVPDFEWLIDARRDIQRDMLDLYELEQRYHETLSRRDDHSLRSAFALPVGAAFSLWRAAFLSHVVRNWDESLKNASELLKETLTTNAVPFGVEFRHRNWMFGFYVNSGIHRLVAVKRDWLRVSSEAHLFNDFDTLARNSITGMEVEPEPLNQWRTTQNALHELIRILKQSVAGDSATAQLPAPRSAGNWDCR